MPRWSLYPCTSTRKREALQIIDYETLAARFQSYCYPRARPLRTPLSQQTLQEGRTRVRSRTRVLYTTCQPTCPCTTSTIRSWRRQQLDAGPVPELELARPAHLQLQGHRSAGRILNPLQQSSVILRLVSSTAQTSSTKKLIFLTNTTTWSTCTGDCYLQEMKNKIGLAQELRDSIDMYQRDMDIAKFFDALLPCFVNVLQTGKPSFVSNSADHVSTIGHESALPRTHQAH